MLTASKNNGTQAPMIDVGLHEAVCYAIVDVGTVYSDIYKKDNRKVVFIWEIPDSRIDIEGKGSLPRALSKHYTNSLGSKANLRADLVSWRTRDFTPEEEENFELQRVLGASCILNIIHKPKRDGGLRAEINSVLPLKGKKLKPENSLTLYGIEENGLEIPDTLPPWLVQEIKASPEYQNLLHPQDAPQADEPQDDPTSYPAPDDDIPF